MFQLGAVGGQQPTGPLGHRQHRDRRPWAACTGRLYELRSGNAKALDTDADECRADRGRSDHLGRRAFAADWDAFQRTSLDTNIASLEDTMVNLTGCRKPRSATRTSPRNRRLMTRGQILVQSGTAVLSDRQPEPATACWPCCDKRLIGRSAKRLFDRDFPENHTAGPASLSKAEPAVRIERHPLPSNLTPGSPPTPCHLVIPLPRGVMNSAQILGGHRHL